LKITKLNVAFTVEGCRLFEDNLPAATLGHWSME